MNGQQDGFYYCCRKGDGSQPVLGPVCNHMPPSHPRDDLEKRHRPKPADHRRNHSCGFEVHPAVHGPHTGIVVRHRHCDVVHEQAEEAAHYQRNCDYRAQPQKIPLDVVFEFAFHEDHSLVAINLCNTVLYDLHNTMSDKYSFACSRKGDGN